MAGGKIVPGAVAITEWQSRVGGDIEACGQASVAMALHVIKGTPTTPDFVTGLAVETVNAGQTTDPPRASTSPNNLRWLAARHGLSLTIHWGDWETAVRAHLGTLPTVVGVNNATAFGGHDSNVHGHYICIFGGDGGDNLIVGDPNTPESTQGEFVTYSWGQLRAASPFAALVPDNNPLAGVPLIGGVLSSMSSSVNGQVRHVTGFDGFAEAIHGAESIDVPQNWNFWDFPGIVWHNGEALTMRGIFIILGSFCIILALVRLTMMGVGSVLEPLTGGGGGTAVGNAAASAGGSVAGNAVSNAAGATSAGTELTEAALL